MTPVQAFVRARRRSTRWAAAAVAVPLALVLSGCLGGKDSRDPATFCGRLRAAQPALTDTSNSASLVLLYQDLDDEAPLQIKDDWHRVTLLLDEVAKADPSDPAGTQTVLADVLSSQTAINSIAVWARDTCNITLGPIPPTVPVGGTGDHLNPPDTSDGSDETDAT